MIKNQYFKKFSSFLEYSNEINQNYFHVISVNIRSVSSIDKFNRFKELLSSFSKLPDIIAIQETWFQKNITQLYAIPGFKAVHSCRDDNYGGTTIYVKEIFHYTVDICRSEGFVNIITITLNNFKIANKPMKIISFYRSQKCVVPAFIDILENALRVNAFNPIVILGDSNIDLYRSSDYGELESMVQNYDCYNAHNLVTRPESGSCIDHIFSNVSEKLFVDSIECDLTDHNLLSCKYVTKKVEKENLVTLRKFCDYRKAKEILKETLPENYDDLNVSELADELMACMGAAMDQSTTVKESVTMLQFDMAPWINKNLQRLILLKRKLLERRRKVKRRENSVNEALRRIGRIIKIASKVSRENYYAENLKELGSDTRKCWSFINKSLSRFKKTEISLKNLEGNVIVDDNDIANCLNNYFTNIAAELRRQICINPDDTVNALRTLCRSNSDFQISSISQSDVLSIIAGMEGNKSPGYDNISAKFVKECAQELAPTFVHLFNKMVSSSIYPNCLKIHKVVPIPKKSNASSIDDYRPVAVLSIVDKIIEKVLFHKLSDYFEGNNLLYDLQFGFRKGCSTVDAVVNVTQYICSGLDNGFNGVAAIFFDLTKAFDLVDHDILIQKLKYYGVGGKEMLLFRDYLSARKQYVQINEAKSCMGSINFGVPQGSGLGPLLFSIYLNDIEHLNLFGKLVMFADDICLLYPYKYDIELKVRMEHDAALIVEFARLNRLLINPNKTKIVRFRPRLSASEINPFSINVNGELVSEALSAKYLGVTLQSNLCWDMHIEQVRSKISPAIGILYKIHKKLNLRTKLLIFESLIQSHLNYMAVTYAYNKHNSSLKSLQCMQNKALKIIYNLPLRYPTVSLFNDYATTVLPIHGQHIYQALIYVFKNIRNIGHQTIAISQNQNTICTRNQANLRVARCRLEKTKQRIDYNGTKQFNELPIELKSQQTISNFKRACKKYLYSIKETLLI